MIADSDQHLRRIDNYLSAFLKGLPRARIYQMLRRGEIRVNGGRVKPGYRLQEGDKIRIPPVMLEERPEPAAPPGNLLEKVRNHVIYRNGDIIVLDKPAGITVHGGTGRSFGIIEILRCLYPGDAGLQLVHRLDQDTSGCLLIARNARMLKILHRAMASGQVRKTYQALLMGRPERSVLEVDQPLRKNLLRSGERMVQIDRQGKAARTRFEVLRMFKSATLANVVLMTGRTHQIRVHAGHINHPVGGDMKYGDREFNKYLRRLGLKRMFLHAAGIALPADTGLARVEFTAPLPDDLLNLLEIIDDGGDV